MLTPFRINGVSSLVAQAFELGGGEFDGLCSLDGKGTRFEKAIDYGPHGLLRGASWIDKASDASVERTAVAWASLFVELAAGEAAVAESRLSHGVVSFRWQFTAGLRCHQSRW